MSVHYQIVQREEESSIYKIQDDGKTWSIPQDPANSDYAEYLRYTEWVEAGNNPEEFWTRLEAGDN